MTAPGSEDDIRRESEFLFRCYSDPVSSSAVPGGPVVLGVTWHLTVK